MGQIVKNCSGSKQLTLREIINRSRNKKCCLFQPFIFFPHNLVHVCVNGNYTFKHRADKKREIKKPGRGGIEKLKFKLKLVLCFRNYLNTILNPYLLVVSHLVYSAF